MAKVEYVAVTQGNQIGIHTELIPLGVGNVVEGGADVGVARIAKISADDHPLGWWQ